jgi:hypothetical protein
MVDRLASDCCGFRLSRAVVEVACELSGELIVGGDYSRRGVALSIQGWERCAEFIPAERCPCSVSTDVVV